MTIAVGKLQSLSRRGLITLGLELTSLLGKIRLFRPSNRAGIIFTMHHVRPVQSEDKFQPNAHLEITPDFLRVVIEALIAEDFEFIRLSDLPDHVARTDRKKPFAIFTLDDGYRNNRDHALPIFENFDVPATIFVTKGFAKREAIIWWEVLAQLIAQQDEIAFYFGTADAHTNANAHTHADASTLHKTQTLDEKIRFFDLFCAAIWSQDEGSSLQMLDRLARRYGLDPLGITKALTLSSQDLAALSQHQLIDLGAHGISHHAIGRLSDDRARQEIELSAQWLAGLTGQKTTSFAFPYGCRTAATTRDFKIIEDLGITLALTTRPGMIRTDRIARLSALPRVSLNGYYQAERYAKALASGIPFRWSKD